MGADDVQTCMATGVYFVQPKIYKASMLISQHAKRIFVSPHVWLEWLDQIELHGTTNATFSRLGMALVLVFVIPSKCSLRPINVISDTFCCTGDVAASCSAPGKGWSWICLLLACRVAKLGQGCCRLWQRLQFCITRAAAVSCVGPME